MSKRKCRGCKEYFDIGTMLKVPLGYFCGYSCSISHAQKKVQLTNRREQNKELKKRKEALKTTYDYIKEADKAVCAYIRARDYGNPCISCGSLPAKKIGGTMDAGHYRSKGAASHLRYNTYNIHSQCVECNRHRSGNFIEYRISLIKKIGINKVEELENNNNIRKFSKEYLIRLKKIFNKRTRIIKRIKGID